LYIKLSDSANVSGIRFQPSLLPGLSCGDTTLPQIAKYVDCGMETIKWQTNDTCSSMDIGCLPKSVRAGDDFSLGCMPALSVTHSAAAAAVCGLWRYKCYAFAFFLPHTVMEECTPPHSIHAFGVSVSSKIPGCATG